MKTLFYISFLFVSISSFSQENSDASTVYSLYSNSKNYGFVDKDAKRFAKKEKEKYANRYQKMKRTFYNCICKNY